MSSAQNATRPGGRTARTRAAVLAAVGDELAEHGYDGLTVDGVATRSGVHRTTVYRRWGTVEGLLVDLLTSGADDSWAPADTGSLAGDLVALNREARAALVPAASLTMAVITASFRLQAAADALSGFWQDRYERSAVVVTRAIERGEVPAGTDAERVLMMATAPLYHQLVLRRQPLSAAVAKRYAEDAAAAARAGIVVRH